MRPSIAFALILVFVSRALCDMGSIPFNSKAHILEPNQRALIACNGREEILILSTDLEADQDTKVLEIMPLPSEPSITNADMEIFKKATDLINKKLLLAERELALSGASPGAGSFAAVEEEPPAGRITFHERIGAHDLSVVHVERADKFVVWAKRYLESQGVDTPEIPGPLEKVIQEYIRDNFTWFVFDVVSLSTSPVTKEAIQFRFTTQFLYYPMRITRTESGDTNVKLLILTRGLFDSIHCLGIPREQIGVVHPPVDLTGTEVRGLSEDIFEMLGEPENIKIRHWNIRGPLNGFDDDIIMGDLKKFINHLRGRPPNNEPPLPGDWPFGKPMM